MRRQLAATIGSLPEAARQPAAVAMLERNGDDPIVVDAVLSGMAGRESALLDALASNPAESSARRAAVTVLSATLVRSKQETAAEAVFQGVADPARPAWLRAAMMAGAESAVLASPLPGTIARARAGGASAPCPTCPGGRAGRGGASAFPAGGRPAAPPAGAPGAGRGGTSIALELSREPAIARLPAGDPLASRAAAVVARIGWPGKAGMATVSALTPEEQQRYAAGEQIYKTICEACHQPDGRGREKLAPSLVGSDFALAADPGIPARILINGKEGTVGLMPPLGAGFTDDQVAAVLTYVRRAWGQTASAVSPAGVTTVRAETASRTRPWTNEELQKLAGPK